MTPLDKKQVTLNLQLGQPDQAKSILEAALAKDPTDMEALLLMAQIFLSPGNHEAGRAFFEDFLAGPGAHAGAAELYGAFLAVTRQFEAVDQFTRNSGALCGKDSLAHALIRGFRNEVVEQKIDVYQEPPTDHSYQERLLSSALNHDFDKEPRFIEAQVEKMLSPKANLDPFDSRWQLHTVLWGAAQSLAQKADIVQLGVFKGAEAAAIASYISLQDQPIEMYLVDTFTGVPEDQWTEKELALGANSSQHEYHAMGDLYPIVNARFSAYDNIHVIQGQVPDALPQVKAERIGLLLLDMNVAYPEIEGAEYFWDKLTPGAIILSDDYGHSGETYGFYEQKLAFDAFAKSKGLEVLAMPTGHGMIVKPW